MKCKSSTQTTPSSLPNLCDDRRFDAITSMRGEIFIFKGRYMWRFTDEFQLVTGYPIPFSDMFQGIPSYVQKIDAAYERNTDSAIIVFHGMIFRFNA